MIIDLNRSIDLIVYISSMSLCKVSKTWINHLKIKLCLQCRDMCSPLNDNPFRAPTAWLCNGYIIGQSCTLWSKWSANFPVATWHEKTQSAKGAAKTKNLKRQWQILEMSISTNRITNITLIIFYIDLHWCLILSGPSPTDIDIDSK